MDELGPIELEFLINNPELLTAAGQAEATMQDVTDAVQVQAQKASAAISTMMGRPIESLKVQAAQLNALASLTPDTTKIAAYHQQVESIEAEIQRLSNIGKTGFDELGNAIDTTVPKAGKLEAAIARATDVGSIGARAVSMFSRQIIGLGVSFLSFEIGAKAIEQLIKWIQNLDIFTGRLDVAKQSMEAFNEIMDNAAKGASKQAADLKILYDAATDVNSSMADRIGAAEQLKNLLPDELKNTTALAIANGGLKDSYDAVSAAILRQATQQAALAKIQDLEAQKLDLQVKQIEIQNKANQDKAQATGYAATTNSQPGGGGSYTPEITKAQNQAGIQQMADFQKQKLQPAIDVINQTIANVEKAAGGAAVLAKALDGSNKLIKGSLDDFNKIIANAGDKKDLENIRASLQAKLDALAPGSDQIQAVRDKLQKVDDLIKEYQVKATSNKTDPSIEKGQSLLASQTSELQKIEALKEQYAAKDDTRDQQAQEAIKARFTAEINNINALNKKRQEFIDDYNKRHKNNQGEAYANSIGLKYIDPASVQPTETNALAGLAGKQALEQTKNQVEQQKAIFAEYEAFKLKAGTDAANQLYGNEIKGFTSYIDYLKSLQPSEADLNSADPYIKAKASALSDYLKTALPQAQDEAQKQSLKQLEQFLTETQSYADKYQEIISKTNDEVNVLTVASNTQQEKLRADGENTAADAVQADYDKRIELAKANGVVALDQQQQQQQQTLDSYKGLATAIESLSVEQAALRIKNAKDIATAEYLAGLTTKAEYDQIIKLIEQANELSKTNVVASAFAGLATEFGKLSQASMGLDKNLGTTLSTLSTLFTQVSSLVTNIPKLENAIKNYSYDQAKASASTGSSFLGTVSTIASMVPIAGAVISAGISIVSGVINFFKASSATAKASAAELVNYQNTMVDNQVKYNELLRDQERSQTDITKLTLNQLEAQQQLLAAQTSGAQADYNTLLQQIQASGQQITGEHTEKYGGFLGIAKKTKVVQDLAGLSDADYDTLEKLYTEGKLTDSTKTWFEQLQSVKNELDDIGTSSQAAADQLNQIATGTTADDITKAIVSGFEAGKSTAADFADDFKTLMQNAAISVFESNYLSGKVADFYNEFAAASASVGGLTPAKIAQLQQDYATVIGDASSQFQDLEKVVGTVTSTSSNSNSLAGQITGITVKQAMLLESSDEHPLIILK